jgi:hypothetical protein
MRLTCNLFNYWSHIPNSPMFALTCRCPADWILIRVVARYHSSIFFVGESCSLCYPERWEALCPLIAHALTEEDALNSRRKPDPITGLPRLAGCLPGAELPQDCQLDIVFRNFTMFWKLDAEHFPLVLHCGVTCKIWPDLLSQAKALFPGTCKISR